MSACLSERLDHLAATFAEKAWEHPNSPLASFLLDHASSLSEFAQEAKKIELPDGEQLTAGQRLAVARLLGDRLPVAITVAVRTFDLPEGYVTFRRDFKVAHSDPGGGTIYGGISAEGEVST